MRTETISMMIDLQLAIRFAPSIPETRVINRAASKMLEIGTYTGCTETLPDKATSDDMGKHVDGMLEELVKGCNQKHVISWGWFAIPDADADLAEMEPGIIEQFTDWNAFNADHCEQVYAQRVMTERLYKEESAA